MPLLNLKFKIKNLKFSRGFTLIEILVVISIMAILSGGLLYSTNNARDKGKDAKRKGDLQAISSALISYYTDKGHFPPSNLNTNPSIDYVSSPYSETWIPNLSEYIQKIPKDPLQSIVPTYFSKIIKSMGNIASSFSKPIGQTSKGQVAAASTNCTTVGSTTTCTIPIKDGADDAKRTDYDWHNNHTVVAAGNPYSSYDYVQNYCYGGHDGNTPFADYSVGRYDSALRFQDVRIPKNAQIDSAKIIFMASDTTTVFDPIQPEGNDHNTNLKPNVHTTLSVELDTNPSPMTGANALDVSSWDTRSTNTTPPVSWNPSVWNDNASYNSEDISSAVKTIIDRPGWNSGQAIMVFWEENLITRSTGWNTSLGNSCHGRVSYSYEAEQSNSAHKAPVLEVSYTTAALPPGTCTDPLASNTGGPLPCTYPIPTTGACDGFTANAYCYRTSENQKVFALWTILENANDPELFGNPNSKCAATDFQAGAPYEGLGKPADSSFNYCVKSPQ